LLLCLEELFIICHDVVIGLLGDKLLIFLFLLQAPKGVNLVILLEFNHEATNRFTILEKWYTFHFHGDAWLMPNILLDWGFIDLGLHYGFFGLLKFIRNRGVWLHVFH
jgi:hypothetical protein